MQTHGRGKLHSQASGLPKLQRSEPALASAMGPFQTCSIAGQLIGHFGLNNVTRCVTYFRRYAWHLLCYCHTNEIDSRRKAQSIELIPMTIEKAIVLGSDLNVAKSLENYLRRCRCDVASTSTIAAARDYLSRDNFDILFLDLSLSDGSGIEFLKEIQARPAKPLVVVTASSNAVGVAADCI